MKYANKTGLSLNQVQTTLTSYKDDKDTVKGLNPIPETLKVSYPLREKSFSQTLQYSNPQNVKNPMNPETTQNPKNPKNFQKSKFSQNHLNNPKKPPSPKSPRFPYKNSLNSLPHLVNKKITLVSSEPLSQKLTLLRKNDLSSLLKEIEDYQESPESQRNEKSRQASSVVGSSVGFHFKNDSIKNAYAKGKRDNRVKIQTQDPITSDEESLLGDNSDSYEQGSFSDDSEGYLQSVDMDNKRREISQIKIFDKMLSYRKGRQLK